jgi:hypothetical protein
LIATGLHLAYRVRPKRDEVTGGVILWFLAQTVAMPLIFCMGFFTRLSPNPMLAVVGSLMGHLIYGALFGAIAGPQAARMPSPPIRRPAGM